MKILSTPLPGLLLIKPTIHHDERGFFLESWQYRRFQEAGLPTSFVQDNFSRSYRSVLRGLHYQIHHAQGKLVQVISGKVFDVAVDIRRGSPTFGQWYGVELDDQNRWQFWIPPGFAHGFCTLSDSADLTYKCSDYYSAPDERTIRWNDSQIGIHWPGRDFILAEKDRTAPLLSALAEIDLPLYQPTP